MILPGQELPQTLVLGLAGRPHCGVESLKAVEDGRGIVEVGRHVALRAPLVSPSLGDMLYEQLYHFVGIESRVSLAAPFSLRFAPPRWLLLDSVVRT